MEIANFAGILFQKYKKILNCSELLFLKIIRNDITLVYDRKIRCFKRNNIML